MRRVIYYIKESHYVIPKAFIDFLSLFLPSIRSRNFFNPPGNYSWHHHHHHSIINQCKFCIGSLFKNLMTVRHPN